MSRRLCARRSPSRPRRPASRPSAASFLAFLLGLGSATALHAQTPASGPAAAVYRETAPAVFLIQVRDTSGAGTGIGSAFLVAPDRLVTNAHVVRAGTPILRAGPVALPLTVERIDEAQDLAILRAPTPLEAPVLRLATGEPAIGTRVFALGNPQGLERSISEGLIAGVRTRDGRRLLQVTAAISPGSSGGPVLSEDGVVVGVTVGYLAEGQNLNFAVPAAAVQQLLEGRTAVGATTRFADEAAAIRRLLASPEPHYSDSVAWAARTAQLREALEAAMRAASGGADQLEVTELALRASQGDLMERYVATVVRADPPRADSARVLLRSAWMMDALLADSSDRASALGWLALGDTLLARRPRDHATHRFRALALGVLGRGPEALQAVRRAVALVGGDAEATYYWTTYHGFTGRYASASADDSVFTAMRRLGYAAWSDWATHAEHLEQREAWASMAAAYDTAFVLSEARFARYACEAGRAYWNADAADPAIRAFRRCIEVGEQGSGLAPAKLAYAHRALAYHLVNRQVFGEAERHARQAIQLDATDPWSFYNLSRALEGLERLPEAARAAEEAVRLSDGGIGTMHFQLGSVHFALEDWVRCARSYRMAMDLVPADDASAYNAALCTARQGFYRDAAALMAQVLVRNPRHPRRADIERQIASWRR